MRISKGSETPPPIPTPAKAALVLDNGANALLLMEEEEENDDFACFFDDFDDLLLEDLDLPLEDPADLDRAIGPTGP